MRINEDEPTKKPIGVEVKVDKTAEKRNDPRSRRHHDRGGY
jgi:hypothetical protein